MRFAFAREDPVRWQCNTVVDRVLGTVCLDCVARGWRWAICGDGFTNTRMLGVAVGLGGAKTLVSSRAPIEERARSPEAASIHTAWDALAAVTRRRNAIIDRGIGTGVAARVRRCGVARVSRARCAAGDNRGDDAD